MQNMNKAQQGQSFIDMVYQETGGFGDIVEIAVLNGKSITEDIQIGETILIDKVVNPTLKNYLQRRKPATAIRYKQTTESRLQGIGYWAIQTDFKIS